MTKQAGRRKGTLHIISALLIGSAFLRVAVGATDAMANNAEINEPQPAQTVQPIGATADILAALNQREQRLEAREARVADRIQALNVAEQEIDKQLIALRQAEEALSATLALADSASETDLGRLTTVYENMAPKDAAALFEQMPPQFAAGFLGMMDPLAAAKVMAGLAPETAYSFSVVLAGRNALVPNE